MCSETSEAVGTIWEHAQLEFQKFLKIRITLLRGQAWGRREYTHRSQPPRSSFPAEMLFQHWSTHLQACLEVYQLVKVKPKSLTGKRIFLRLL